MTKWVSCIKPAAFLSLLFFAAMAAAQPNLAAYQPTGWSDAVVVANAPGGTNFTGTLTPSDTLYVNWAVANFGNAPATSPNGFWVDLYVDGVYADASWQITFPLNPNAYVYVIDEPIGSLGGGTHTVEIVIDADGFIAESNESDNSYTKTITIQSGQSDLTRSTDSLSSTNLNSGDTMSASVTITNQPCLSGSGSAGAFHVGWYFSADPGFSGASSFFETAVSGCNSNATVSFNQQFSFDPATASGTYYLGYKIDDENELSECTTTNNGIFPFTLKVVGVADLTPQNISVNPNPAAVGGSVSVNYTVANVGAATAPASHTKVQIKDAAQNLVVEQTFATAGIAAGSSTNESRSISLAGVNPGSYSAFVIVDNNKEVTQASNTNNDSSSATFTVGAGLLIIPTFDSSITSDPQASTIEATINSAILAYETNFSDPITVHITFDEMSSGLGQSSSFITSLAYSSYASALASHATTADDAVAILDSVPNVANNPVNNNSSIDLKLPLARALGFSVSGPGGLDGTIGLNTSLCNLSAAQTDGSKYSLFAVASHEIDEVLGLGSALDQDKGSGNFTGLIMPEDLFRYDGTGARSFTTNVSAAAFFSLDSTTDLARFNQFASGDLGDWYSPGGQTPQVQDAFGTPGSTPVLGVELRALDVIGFTLVAVKTNQTITFGPLGNRAFGEPPFSVSATTSSGLPVSFAILSGPATISGSNVTVTGTGTVTVRASQSGNASYNPAPNVDQPFTVFSPPGVSSLRSGANLILAWPTNVAGFTLLTSTNLAISNSWTVVSPAPVIVNGQYTVTNSFTNRYQFYRLKK